MPISGPDRYTQTSIHPKYLRSPQAIRAPVTAAMCQNRAARIRRPTRPKCNICAPNGAELDPDVLHSDARPTPPRR